MSKRRTGLGSVGLAGILMILPAGSVLSAQVIVDRDDTPASREIRADQLLEEAISHGDDRSMWDYASSLYRKSASLREEGDSEAVRSLRMAANLAYYGGFKAQAVQDLERAAEHALASGDLAAAALAFVDAAWVSQKLGSEKDVQRFVRRGLGLADSPYLSASDRMTILDRLASGRNSVALRDDGGKRGN